MECFFFSKFCLFKNKFSLKRIYEASQLSFTEISCSSAPMQWINSLNCEQFLNITRMLVVPTPVLQIRGSYVYQIKTGYVKVNIIKSRSLSILLQFMSSQVRRDIFTSEVNAILRSFFLRMKKSSTY